MSDLRAIDNFLEVRIANTEPRFRHHWKRTCCLHSRCFTAGRFGNSQRGSSHLMHES